MESEIQGVQTLQNYIAIHWSKNDSLNKQQHKDMLSFNNIENEEAFVIYKKMEGNFCNDVLFS